MANQLGRLAIEQLLKVGHFPVERITHSHVAERIIGNDKKLLMRFDPSNDFAAMKSELVQRLSNSAIEAATVALLRPTISGHCPQYEVFQQIRNPATFLNFNNDGLATKYCTNHLVIDVHGTSLDEPQRDALNWNNLISHLQMFPTARRLIIPRLLLPQMEPLSIAETPDYQLAWRRINQAKNIVLIGYSFGGMDDQVAYQLLVSGANKTKAPVTVIGPDVRELVDKIEHETPYVSVFGLNAYWDALAKSILASHSLRLYKTCTHERFCQRCIRYAYQAILNSDKGYQI